MDWMALFDHFLLIIYNKYSYERKLIASNKINVYVAASIQV